MIDFPDPEQQRRFARRTAILDKAGQKGTGKWTTQSALDLGVPIPTITAAVDARGISALKTERVNASKLLSGPRADGHHRQGAGIHRRCPRRPVLQQDLLLRPGHGPARRWLTKRRFNYRIHLDEVARIWKAGCIIRAVFLDEMKKAFKADPAMVNLLLNERFRASIAKGQAA